MTKDFRSLTTQYDRVTSELRLEVALSEAFDPAIPIPDLLMVKFNAIWDTGATNSAISRNVVSVLGLKPTGLTVVHTAKGTMEAQTYLVNILLPNNAGFHGVTVTEGDLSEKVDVLIGMDIIGTGDFSVTNADGRTCVSFRTPSISRIDYVEEARTIREKAQRVIGFQDPDARRRDRNKRKRSRQGNR